MNQKIPFHDLASRIAAVSGTDDGTAEIFVRNFFDLLAESMISGESVKIKGLGSFTVVEAEGEKHIGFIPDKDMAEAINAPFAIFEPVKLNDAVSDEMLTEVSKEDQPVENTPESTVEQSVETVETSEEHEPVEEIVEETVSEITEPIPAVNSNNPQSETAIIPEPKTVVVTPEAIPEPTPEPAAQPETETETETVKEPEQPQSEEKAVAIQPTQTLNPPVIRPLDEEPEEYVDHKRNNDRNNAGGGNGNFWLGLIVGIIVGLALGACGAYLAIDYFFPTQTTAESSNDNIEAEVLAELLEVTPAETDSVTQTETETADTVQPAPSEPTEVTKPVEPVAPAAPKIVYDTVRRGYLLPSMAKKYYGNKDYWGYIYEENKAKIGNPNRMQPGVVLVIPPAEKYGINANNAESLRKAKAKISEILSKYPR